MIQLNITSKIKSFDLAYPYLANACAQDFAYPDLFGALLGHEGSQSKQAQARNKYGQTGKNTGQLAYKYFFAEFAVINCIHKAIIM